MKGFKCKDEYSTVIIDSHQNIFFLKLLQGEITSIKFIEAKQLHDNYGIMRRKSKAGS